MHKIALLLVVAALAGCADTPAAPEDTRHLVAHVLIGTVTDPAINPVEGAQVVLGGTNLTAVTDAAGSFEFSDAPSAPATLTVTATGFSPATTTVGSYNESVSIVLQPVASVKAAETLAFQGHWQCALEALIISPSCDAIMGYMRDEYGTPTPDVFSSESEFFFSAMDGWENLVIDVRFDLSGHPGLAGLRAQLAGTDDPDALNDYANYGDFTGSETFTFLVEAGADYGGDRSVPINATDFLLEIYPFSHGWHATCAATCLLGLGTAADMQFDVFVTTFYEPVPEGWSFLA